MSRNSKYKMEKLNSKQSLSSRIVEESRGFRLSLILLLSLDLSCQDIWPVRDRANVSLMFPTATMNRRRVGFEATPGSHYWRLNSTKLDLARDLTEPLKRRRNTDIASICCFCTIKVKCAFPESTFSLLENRNRQID